MSDVKKPSEGTTTDGAGDELTPDQLESVAGGATGAHIKKGTFDWQIGEGDAPATTKK